MGNISKIKRDNLLAFLEEIKESHNDDKSIRAINEIRNQLTEKKYGLVWEEHTEKVDEMIKDYIPVFVEEKENYIDNNGANLNYIIEGDNLHTLYLLERTHKSNIDIIYIDPPYNTMNSYFIYDDKIVDKEDLFRHSKWLSFMSKRLKVARELLKEEGIIFISIDENEMFNLKVMLDEIFNENNYVGLFSVENNPKGRKNSNFISVCNDYVLVYAKNKDKSYFIENIPKSIKDVVKDENGNYIHNSGKRVLVGEGDFNDLVDDFDSSKHYSVYYSKEKNDIQIIKEYSVDDKNTDLISQGYDRYISYSGEDFIYNTYTEKRLRELYEEEALDFKNNKIYEKNFNTTIRIKSIITNKKYRAVVNNTEKDYEIDVKTTSAQQELKDIFKASKSPFSNPKNPGLIKLLISLIDNKNAVVLDFFAGSGTTAQAVLELNEEDKGERRFIITTNNETSFDNKIKYFVKKGMISKKPKAKTKAEEKWLEKWEELQKDPNYLQEIESEEYKNIGICRSITYPRLKTVITGKRSDGSNYSKGMNAKCKYLVCDYVDRKPKDYFLSEMLCNHIKEMIELQNFYEIDNKKYVLILNKEDYRNYLLDNSNKSEIEEVWVNQNIIFNSKEIKELKKYNYRYIPKEYFGYELKEAGE